MIVRRNAGLLMAAVVLMAGAPGAQAQMADKPASPRSVPTDELPPFGMLDDAGKLIPVPVMPRPGQPGPSIPPPPVAAHPAMPSADALPMDLAISGARATLKACLTRHAKVAVAVVDADGKPQALLMESGSAGSVFVAMRKAAATLAFRLPSSQIAQKLEADPSLLPRLTPVMFLSGGALPIYRGERMIGAIASSGAHGAGPIGAEDEICAKAGLAQIDAALKAQPAQ